MATKRKKVKTYTAEEVRILIIKALGCDGEYCSHPDHCEVAGVDMESLEEIKWPTMKK